MDEAIWHHMMLLLLPMESHDQKGNVASHFNHPDLTNTMLPLITLLAKCDTDKGTTSIT